MTDQTDCKAMHREHRMEKLAGASEGAMRDQGAHVARCSLAGWFTLLPLEQRGLVCSHHSCVRPTVPGLKTCEHHRALSAARFARWYNKRRATT